MRLLILFFLLLSFVCSGQPQSAPDSVAFSLESVTDSTFAVVTELYFFGDDGTSTLYSATSAPMDSSTVADFIRQAEVYGGKVGEVDIVGRLDVARSAQKFFAQVSRSAVPDGLANMFQQHTGISLDEAKTEYDPLFVGEWLLISRRSGSRIDLPINVVRRGNGRLVVEVTDLVTGSISRTRATINSRDEIVIRNMLDISGQISLYRVRPDSRRLISADGSVLMAPAGRRAEKSAAKN